MTNDSRILSVEECKNQFALLKNRFQKNMKRHEMVQWEELQKKLENNIKTLWSLREMEITGGEPDVVEYDKQTKEYIFYDCSRESPIGRRNLCYDYDALASRKQHKPKNNAMDMANNMGIQILTKDQYYQLQKLGEFDLKTSSWVKTPEDIRKLGGAIFGDRRYNHVFVYHNGAESYYSSRGFRGSLRV